MRASRGILGEENEVSMAPSDRVARVLRSVLSLSLAPLAGACGGIDTDGFEEITCNRDGTTPVLEGLQPATPADYLELREVEGSLVREAHGTPCATATDPAACEAAIAAATTTQGFMVGQCVDFCPLSYLVVNSGDEVTVLDTAAAVRAWMAPLETDQEAVLAVRLAGYSVTCRDPDRGGVKKGEDGYEVLATKITSSCDPIETTLYVVSVDSSGESVKELESEVIESDSGACIGRRPAALARRPARGATRTGAYFAQVARLEAASVAAFEILRRELVHHGAPAALIEQAEAARGDEVRHARVMRRVAARHGGIWRAPRVERRPPRSVEEIAVENAAEGCVRETYGALVGMWQARFARDPVVRRVMRRVARDEAAHAALAWEVDRWARSRLSAEARRRVEAARQEALGEVMAEARRGYEQELVAVAGLPARGAAERLARRFVEAMPELSAG